MEKAPKVTKGSQEKTPPELEEYRELMWSLLALKNDRMERVPMNVKSRTAHKNDLVVQIIREVERLRRELGLTEIEVDDIRNSAVRELNDILKEEGQEPLRIVNF